MPAGSTTKPPRPARPKRDALARGRADAHGVDRDALLRGLAGRDARVAREILSVAHEHQQLLAVGRGAEGFLGLVEHGADVAAAARDDLAVEGLQRFAEGRVVAGERRLQERAAGEGDQAHAIALELAQQIDHRELRARQPVGLHVRGQHAARDIDGEEHVGAAVTHVLHAPAEGRAAPARRSRGRGPPAAGRPSSAVATQTSSW